MFSTAPNPALSKNTSHALVLPFYLYAAISFLVATILLFNSPAAFLQHHFHPQTLSIAHVMALGWGTMMIFGAGHQLIPVLIGRKMYSEFLGYSTFVLAGVGIPLLVYAFYTFTFSWQAQSGAILINAAILLFLVNTAISMAKSKQENVHAVFVFTATLWLLITCLIGLFLVYNFTHNVLSFDSLHYLPLHAHLGIAGWFLLLVLGVGSRLIPMFLISKYNSVRTLWVIYGLVNSALILFLTGFIYRAPATLYFVSTALIAAAIILFGRFCYACYKDRLRKKVDPPLKMSLLSVAMMGIPVLLLIVILVFVLIYSDDIPLILTYGFCIFFGWITAIILGMTFKTLPFILWNSKFTKRASGAKTPSPKDLFSTSMFKAMAGAYLAGFCVFVAGILLQQTVVLKTGATLLVITAFLYNTNVFKMIFYKHPSDS